MECLPSRKPKILKRLLKIQNTNEANILMYLFFKEHLPNYEKCIFALFDEHEDNCECDIPVNNIFRRMKCSEYFDFHKEYESFKGFWYYRKHKRTLKRKYRYKAVFHLTNQSVLKFLTYLPLYHLTQDYTYLEKAVNAGMPDACYEMYELKKDNVELLKYAAKYHLPRAQQRLATLFDKNSYYYLKHCRIELNSVNQTALYFAGKHGIYDYKDFYKRCHDNCKNAVMTWLLITKELNVCKDVSLIIAKKIWKTRGRNARDWNFIIEKEGWISWTVKNVFNL